MIEKSKGGSPVGKGDFVLDLDAFVGTHVSDDTVRRIYEMEETTNQPTALKKIVEFYKTYGLGARDLLVAHQKLVEVVKGITKKLAAGLQRANSRVDALETGYGEKGDLSLRDYLLQLESGINGNEKAIKELARYLKEEAVGRKADIDHIYGLLDGLARNQELTARQWDSEQLPNGWVEYKGRRKAKL